MSTKTFMSPFCYVEINEPNPNLNLFQLSFVCHALCRHTFALQVLFRIMNPEQALAKTRWWFAWLSKAGWLIIHDLELMNTIKKRWSGVGKKNYFLKKYYFGGFLWILYSFPLFFGWLLESKYIMFWYTFCCRYSPRPRFALVFWKIMIMFSEIYWFFWF